jgi:hypothetical protein
MYSEDIRNRKPISINKQVRNNKIHTQNNKNNEQYEISDNKDQVEPTYEHSQRTQYTLFSIVTRYLDFFKYAIL